MGIEKGASSLGFSLQTMKADYLLMGRSLYLGLKHFDFVTMGVGMGSGVMNTMKIIAPYAAMGVLFFP